MPYALSQTYCYPLTGQTEGQVVAQEMPVDNKSLPIAGYTGVYGRRFNDLETMAMNATPAGRIYRGVRIQILIPTWNPPPTSFEELDTASLLYADTPCAAVEDHLRANKLHINGYTLDQAVTADPTIIDFIAKHPTYAKIRAVVWISHIQSHATKLVTVTSDAHIASIRCLALPYLHVALPQRRVRDQGRRMGR